MVQFDVENSEFWIETRLTSVGSSSNDSRSEDRRPYTETEFTHRQGLEALEEQLYSKAVCVREFLGANAMVVPVLTWDETGASEVKDVLHTPDRAMIRAWSTPRSRCLFERMVKMTLSSDEEPELWIPSVIDEMRDVNRRIDLFRGNVAVRAYFHTALDNGVVL